MRDAISSLVREELNKGRPASWSESYAAGFDAALRWVLEQYEIHVLDMNGVEIEPGQHILIHTDSGVQKAVVSKPLPDSPTVNAPGHWVDVVGPDGTEGMPSYLIEVVD